MKKILFMLTLLILSINIATAQDAVTLRLWAHQEGAFNDATQVLIDAYVAEHPNVSIEMETFEYNLYLQTLQTAMPAGDEADILGLFGSWVCSYSSRLAPMPEGLVDTALYFDATMDGYTCGDGVYGLPQEFNMEYGTVLVNQSMFESAGLTYPPAWTDWEAFISDAKALTQTGDNGLMTVAGYHFTNADAIVFSFLAGILQNGGDYWNEDHTAFNFNTAEARTTLNQMMRMVDEGIVDPVLFNDTANWSGTAFFTNQAAIALIGPWAVYLREDFPDFGAFDYVALPSFGTEPNFAADSGWGLAVSQNSVASDVAWDFVKFAAANSNNALQWNLSSHTIPALRGLVEDETSSATILADAPWLESVFPLLPYGTYIGDMPDRDLVFYEIIYPYILDTLQGVMTVDDALVFIDADANATFNN